MDQRQLAGHRAAGMGIIVGCRLQIGMVVQTHLTRANTEHTEQDPHHQQRHIEEETIQRTQQQEHHAHHRRGHQQSTDHGKMADATKQHFHSVIQMPVLAQLEQTLSNHHQQHGK